jgi:glycosyltransferase involved in cell wall biosynthesis
LSPAAKPTLLHVFPGFGVGGAQMRLAQIANRWGARFAHRIVSLDGNLACRERLDPTLDVAFLDPGLVKTDAIGNLRKIRAALASWRPDVLVTSNWGAIEWAIATAWPGGARPRHIHTEDGFGPEERDRQLPRRVWTRRLALRRAVVVLPSRTLLSLATDVWRLNPAHLRYIPNGVDVARFAPAVSPPAPPWPATTGSVIGTVAALRPEKNLSRLLQAFRLVCDALPAAHLVIVGDGPERSALHAEAATLGLASQVTFAGHLTQPEAAYQSFDVFALSSDTEQMPLSVLEAMAAARPVAATAVGDIATMLSAENLPYVTPRAAAPLAAALLSLLRDPARRTAIGAANHAKAQRDYGQDRMCEAYAALYEGA